MLTQYPKIAKLVRCVVCKKPRPFFKTIVAAGIIAEVRLKAD
jgi:hypothetical protein